MPSVAGKAARTPHSACWAGPSGNCRARRSSTGPSGPATLYGRALDVTDPATVGDDVAGRPVTVDVVGLDAATVPPCAMTGSLSFARRTLPCAAGR